jgi:cephalosporin-C deacetylase-like acetyl esterase
MIKVFQRRLNTLSICIIIILLNVILFGCTDNNKKTVSSDKNLLWDLDQLYKPPKMKWFKHEGPIYSLVYQGLPYKGKDTEVFAYYATPGTLSGVPDSDKNLPGIVLINGSSGHAEEGWVKLWAGAGYAALSIDLLGCGPNTAPLPTGGPQVSYQSLGGPDTDYLDFDWNYHAVAKVILAHSLLMDFKEVDPNRTAMEGNSLGGQIACVVASLDNRFKAAVSVYGCGYLYENGLFADKLAKMQEAQRNKWIQSFDPSNYLSSITIPMLFVTGATDWCYPLDIYVKSYRLVKGSRNICMFPFLFHGGSGYLVKEMPMFIGHYCRNSAPLPTLSHPEIINGQVLVKDKSYTRLSNALLHYTTDKGPYPTRKWYSREITTIVGSTIYSEKPPVNTSAWFITVTDEHNANVSSEVIFE